MIEEKHEHHDHGHEHHEHHGHHHHHHFEGKSARNILIAFLLNISFSIIEFIGGALTSSVAIMSDAIHDAGDALSIGISYFLEKKSKKERNEKYTYGYLRLSVLGAFITTMILLIGSIFVIISAVKRFITPVEIDYNGMIGIAIFGLVINSLAAYITRDKDSLNQRAVNLHMLEDVLGWLVVLIGAILMKFTNISIIDSILSIGVAVFIFINAFRNLRDVLDIFLERTPRNISVKKIKNELLRIDGVKDIHHIHIWTMDGEHNYATMHAIVKDVKIKNKIKEKLLELNIDHPIIEIETEDEECDEKAKN